MNDSLRALAVGPSAWLVRFSRWIPAGSRVLEIACGMGRNTWYLAHLGAQVVCADRHVPPEIPSGARFEQRDLEDGSWPWEPASFDAVVGINYLHRPAFHHLCGTVRPGGILLYETFTVTQGARAGRPRRPEHLLGHGELLRLVPADWRVLAYEDGLTDFGQHLQRIAAVRPSVIEAHDPWLCAAR